MSTTDTFKGVDTVVPGQVDTFLGCGHTCTTTRDAPRAARSEIFSRGAPNSKARPGVQCSHQAGPKEIHCTDLCRIQLPIVVPGLAVGEDDFECPFGLGDLLLRARTWHVRIQPAELPHVDMDAPREFIRRQLLVEVQVCDTFYPGRMSFGCVTLFLHWTPLL